MALRAAVVTRFLRGEGAVVLPSGTSRARQGVRVKQSLARVLVTVDYDSLRAAERYADVIEETLAARFAVKRCDGARTMMWVSERTGG